MTAKHRLLALFTLLVCVCANGLAQTPPQNPPAGSPPNRPRIEPPKKGVCPLPILSALPTYADTSFFAQSNVPHGKIEQVNYKNYAGQDKRMHVYLPPDYDKDTSARYPVLYLNHGGGDDDSKWASTDPKNGGNAGNILDNLIAAGKAKPMIVVMPNTRACATLAPSAPGNDDACTQEYLKDVIPLIDKQYRSKASRAYRALAGLSMGGGQTMRVVGSNPDQFAYVAVWSMGVNPQTTADFEKRNAPLLSNADKANKQIKLFEVTCGEKDTLAFTGAKNLDEILKKNKIKHEMQVTPGGHTWINWRQYLNSYAQKLFR